MPASLPARSRYHLFFLPMNKRWTSWAAHGRLLAFLFGGYKLQIVILVVLGFLSGILGGLGIGVVIPLFSFAVKGGMLGSDFISQIISRTFVFFGIEPTLNVFLILISSLFIVKAVVLVVFGWVTARISSDYEQHTMDRLYEFVFSADWPFLLEQKIGHLQNLLTVNVPYVSRLMLVMSSGFLNFANFLIFFIIVLKLSPSVTLLALGLGTAILLFSRPLLKRSRAYSHLRALLSTDIAHEVNENMTGLKIIKAMGVERTSARLGSEFFGRANILRIKGSVVKTINATVIEPVSMIFIVVLFMVLYHRPQFDLGVFVVIIYSIHRIFIYVNLLQDSLHSVSGSLPFLQQIVSFQTAAAGHEETGRGRRAFHFEEPRTPRNRPLSCASAAF